ncbi:MAG TPA: homocysteine S-methyltransferase family protein [Naasia sp.]|jgi:S-methylmethionine-dependent homocysteine/selenocysteine methylase
MTRNRRALPEDRVLLTDGGLETTLIFREGIDLPLFAACDLLRTGEGREQLLAYYDEFARLAVSRETGLLLDTATWRANPDWTDLLGYTPAEFEDLNRTAVELAASLRDRYDSPQHPVVIAGVVGPRGDGYQPGTRQSVEEARAYHSAQIRVLAEAGADVIEVLTMNYPEEGAGAALAAADAGIPVLISFTVETDGRLASGETLQEAVAFVEDASGGSPAGYLVNCAHPDHLPADLSTGASWTSRLVGYRANASRQSHQELDEAPVLDDGDPSELGGQVAALRAQLPGLRVLGGCCGTDFRHIAAIAERLPASA